MLISEIDKENEVPLLELKNISFSYGEEPVFKNLGLKIFTKDSVGIIGPSGAGKSCLLKLLSGLLEPQKGELLYMGKDFHKMDSKSKIKSLARMGMLFQRNALFDSLTCFENIAFPLRERSDKTNQEIESVVNHFLEAVDILHARDLFPSEISGGMQKRLGVARALALNPEIVFYDDPTAGLDPITSRKIIELILKMKKESDATIVSVINDLNRVYQVANKLLMVVDHTILDLGSPQMARQNPDLRVKQFLTGQTTGPLTVSG